MRKKGSYHKNRPFRLLVAAALRFVQSYLNDIAFMRDSEKTNCHHEGSIVMPQKSKLNAEEKVEIKIGYLSARTSVL